MHVCVCVCVHLCVHLCVYCVFCVYVCTFVCAFVCVCVCVCVFVFGCMEVYLLVSPVTVLISNVVLCSFSLSLIL